MFLVRCVRERGLRNTLEMGGMVVETVFKESVLQALAQHNSSSTSIARVLTTVYYYLIVLSAV